MSGCLLCPRNCGADRERGKIGFCGTPDDIYVAKIMLHKWEEPCICTGVGAGTIFFSGCNMHCVYCQNAKISGGICGKVYSQDNLASEIIKLQEAGASCIEFVTPTHYTDHIAKILKEVKPQLNIPVVWNSGGYEKPETLKFLNGLVDVYMPDLKYFSDDIALRYSHAPNYFEVATSAINEMLSQVGSPVFDGSGKLQKGVIIRHLVLPSHRRDSMELLSALADRIGNPQKIILSLMSQYTPDFYIENHPDCSCKNLTRKITSFEYNSVLEHAINLGFDGYFQGRNSARTDFTPDF